MSRIPTATLALTAALACGGDDPESEREWCNNFSPDGDPGFELLNADGDPIVDGGELPIVCGGQGLVMMPIYPHIGGFEPPDDSVELEITVDVDGANVGPAGHFFQDLGADFTVDCSDIPDDFYGSGGGYVSDFIPVFPPDSIPIADIAGKSGTLHVTLHAPDGDIKLDAVVTLTNEDGLDSYGCNPY
jgi:hypothetical protein